MVFAKLLLQTHERICKIIGTSDSIPFAGKTVIVSGDLYKITSCFCKTGEFIGLLIFIDFFIRKFVFLLKFNFQALS